MQTDLQTSEEEAMIAVTAVTAVTTDTTTGEDEMIFVFENLILNIK